MERTKVEGRAGSKCEWDSGQVVQNQKGRKEIARQTHTRGGKKEGRGISRGNRKGQDLGAG